MNAVRALLVEVARRGYMTEADVARMRGILRRTVSHSSCSNVQGCRFDSVGWPVPELLIDDAHGTLWRRPKL